MGNCLVNKLKDSVNADLLKFGEIVLAKVNKSFDGSTALLEIRGDKTMTLTATDNGYFTNASGEGNIGNTITSKSINAKPVSAGIAGDYNLRLLGVYNLTNIVSGGESTQQGILYINALDFSKLCKGRNSIGITWFKLNGNITDFFKKQFEIGNLDTTLTLSCKSNSIIIDAYSGQITVGDSNSNRIFYVTPTTNGFNLSYKLSNSGAITAAGAYTYLNNKWTVSELTL